MCPMSENALVMGTSGLQAPAMYERPEMTQYKKLITSNSSNKERQIGEI